MRTKTKMKNNQERASSALFPSGEHASSRQSWMDIKREVEECIIQHIYYEMSNLGWTCLILDGHKVILDRHGAIVVGHVHVTNKTIVLRMNNQ
jgi:hypothetical protein